MIAFGVHINNNNVMFVVRSVGRGGRRAARDLLRRSIFHENDRKECKSPAAATADGRPDARGCARLRHRPIDLRYSACHVIIMYIIYYIDIRITVLLYTFNYGCRKCALRTNVCFSFATMYLNNIIYAQHKTFWCAYSKYIIVGIV